MHDQLLTLSMREDQTSLSGAFVVPLNFFKLKFGHWFASFVVLILLHVPKLLFFFLSGLVDSNPLYNNGLFLLVLYKYILTHISNAKCFRNVTLINKRGLAVIIVPFRGYGRLSPNHVMV